MKELILVTCYWTHLIAASVWIGGIIFILFFAMPSARQALGPESGKLMGEVSRRFTPAANLSIIVLAVTGAALAGLSGQYTGIALPENNWSAALMAKTTFVLGMVGVHLYRWLVLGPGIMRTTEEAEREPLRKFSLNLVRANLALGLLVLLASGAMSVLRGY